MAAFEYLAVDSLGKQKKGVIEADSARQARQSLREKNWFPLEVSESRQRKGRPALAFLNLAHGLSAKDLALISRQLATLVQAALPIEEALKAAAAQSTSNKVNSLLLGVRSRVLEGHSLAVALGEFPSAFPQIYCATIAAGERAGHIGLVLEQLADYTEQRYQSRQRIQLALLYPSILLVCCFAIVGFLLGYVVPDIIGVFSDTGQELPALTRALIATSEALKNWGALGVIAMCALAFGVSRLLKRESLRRVWHGTILELPMFGSLSRAIQTSRFASTLSILARSGVPLVDALSIASAVIANLHIKLSVQGAVQRVREGCSLTRALDETNVFPPMMMHMVAGGERSGNLDEMLARAAKNQEGDLAAKIAVLVGLFEPLMLVVMGAVVLLIVLAVLLPILSLNQLVS